MILLRCAIAAFVCAVVYASPAGAAELKIFGSRVTKVMIGELGPAYEQASGHKLTVFADVAAVTKRRIEAGEDFDVAVLVNFQTDDLIKSGKIIADTRADIMKSGIGVAVKKGAPRPDISTVDAFKQALLNARSITYLKEGASTIHLDKIFAQLGIADAIHDKTIKTTGEEVSENVASGVAEIGIIVVPNILSVPGADLVGPLPAEINAYIMFTAGVSAASPNQAAAREVIRLMQSPEALRVMKANGMEPG
jgi:molybdate transport system substrate-binding protein